MTPFGPWLPDQPAFGREGVVTAKNVIAGAMGYHPLASLESVSALPTIPLAEIQPNCFAVRQIGLPRTRVLIAGRPQGIGFFRFFDAITGLNISNPAHNNIRAGWFTRFEDFILAADIGMPLQRMALGASQLENVPNAPRSRLVTVIGQFVVLGHLFDPATQTDFLRQVSWSGFNDMTQWTPGTNQSGTKFMRQPVQALVGGETEGLIFLSDRIVRMEYIGGDFVFGFEELFRIGTDSPASIVKYDDRMFFASDANFWQVYANQNLTPISDESVSRFYRSTSTREQRSNVSGAIDYRNRLVCWIYGDKTTGLNNMLIFDLKTESWSFAQVPNAYRLTQVIQTSERNNDERLLGAVSPQGVVHTFTGPPLPAEIETAEMGGTERSYIDSVRAHISGAPDTNITCRMGARNSLIAPVQYTLPKEIEPEANQFNVRLDARYWRVRFNISGSFSHAIGFDANVQPSGDR